MATVITLSSFNGGTGKVTLEERLSDVKALPENALKEGGQTQGYYASNHHIINIFNSVM